MSGIVVQFYQFISAMIMIILKFAKFFSSSLLLVIPTLKTREKLYQMSTFANKEKDKEASMCVRYHTA